MARAFPLALIVLYIGAGICDGVSGRWQQVSYSVCAIGITFVVYLWPWVR